MRTSTAILFSVPFIFIIPALIVLFVTLDAPYTTVESFVVGTDNEHLYNMTVKVERQINNQVWLGLTDKVEYDESMHFIGIDTIVQSRSLIREYTFEQLSMKILTNAGVQDLEHQLEERVMSNKIKKLDIQLINMEIIK